MSRSLLVFIALASLAVAPGGAIAAVAGVPDSSQSTVPPCIVLCPQGDIVYQVVVRYPSGEPFVNSTVDLLFCGNPGTSQHCPQVHLCPAVPGDPYIVGNGGCLIQAVTNSLGIASFPIRGGGTCAKTTPQDPVQVRADGVVFGYAHVASPDQDGNSIVDGADDAMAVARIGTTDGTADMNCDGATTQADIDQMRQHSSHACLAPTSIGGPSWGGLKILYR